MRKVPNKMQLTLKAFGTVLTMTAASPGVSLQDTTVERPSKADGYIRAIKIGRTLSPTMILQVEKIFKISEIDTTKKIIGSNFTFSQDGTRLISTLDHETIEIRKTNGELISTIKGLEGIINDPIIATDGKVLIVTTDEPLSPLQTKGKKLRVYQDGMLQFALIAKGLIQSATIGKDGSVCYADDEGVKKIDANGKLVWQKPLRRPVYSLTIGREGSVAIGTAEAIIILDPQGNEFYTGNSFSLLSQYTIFSEQGNCAWFNFNKVHIFNPKTEKEIEMELSPIITPVHEPLFSPNGNLWIFQRPNHIKRVNSESGDEIWKGEIGPHSKIAFTSDGKYAVYAVANVNGNEINIIDTSNNQVLASFSLSKDADFNNASTCLTHDKNFIMINWKGELSSYKLTYPDK